MPKQLSFSTTSSTPKKRNWRFFKLSMDKVVDEGGSAEGKTSEPQPLESEGRKTKEPKKNETKAEGASDETTGAAQLKKLQKELEKERALREDINSKLDKATQDLELFKDVDPAKYAALIKERETLASVQKEQERIHAELSTRFETESIQLKTAHQSEIAAFKTQVEELQNQLLTLTKTNLLRDEYLLASGRHDETDDGVSHFGILQEVTKNRFVLDEKKSSLIVVDDSGNPMTTGEDKKPMPPREYLKSLHQHPVLGSCFQLENVPSGSGANSVASRRSANQTNPLPLSNLEKLRTARATRKAI